MRMMREAFAGSLPFRIAYTFVSFVGFGMRFPVSCVNSSVFTSKQPPQALEYVSNSLLIHSAAALMPLPVEAGTSDESVCRDWKLTSFSMVCWMRCGETSFSATAICGSDAGVGRLPACTRPCPFIAEPVNQKIVIANKIIFILNMASSKTSTHHMCLLLDARCKRF